MNRHEFLNKLAMELGRLPREEVEDILAYYNEYFDDAGPENEARALEELGSPVKIATQIKADYAVKQLDRMPQGRSHRQGNYQEEGQGQYRQNGQDGQYSQYGQQNQKPKKGIPVVLWVILGIFAAPVALPVAIAGGVLVIVLFAVLGALALAALITIGAVFAAGIICIVAGFASLFTNFVNAIMAIGLGVATVGAMLLLGMAVIIGVKALFRLIARKTNESRQRKVAEKQAQDQSGRQNVRPQQAQTEQPAHQDQTDQQEPPHRLVQAESGQEGGEKNE